MSHNNRKFGAIIIVIITLTILILVTIIYLLFLRPTDQNKENPYTPQSSSNSTTPDKNETLVACYSTANSPLETIIGYDEIKLTPIQQTSNSSDRTELTSLPTLSLSEFKTSDWPEFEVVYNVVKDNMLYSGFWGVATGMELCDENNMTNIPLDDPSDVQIIEEESPAASASSYIQGGHIPSKPGTYRVDGYLFFDGKWHLTHRFESVTFTK